MEASKIVPVIDRTGPPRPEEGWQEIGTGMSNFDHTIDGGFEEALRGERRVFGGHAAGGHWGRVWFDGENFREEVWRYGSPMEVLIASTLEALMQLVNAEYGYE